MISNKEMNAVLRIAEKQNARLILTGDTKQHNSVERGDALRTLQEQAHITPITISRVQRQKNETYKQAVSFLAKADTEKGFSKLNRIGAIHEIIDAEERTGTVAEDYYQSISKRRKRGKPKEVLVISPTHAEGERITERIREKLKQHNALKGDEKEFLTLRNRQFTTAEKERIQSYTSGDWLIFHQNVKGIQAGSKYEITGTKGNAVNLKDLKGKTASITLDKSKAYNVFAPKPIKISEGDKLRITGNGKTAEGVHLFNGSAYEVKGFDKKGNIKLSNGTTLTKDYGTFAMGYVLTSHASQGKTVDKVIISQSSMSFRASSQEQFYVSVSRGREAVSIYTDDKKELLEAVSQTSQRKAAKELLSGNGQLVKQAVAVNRMGWMKKLKAKAIETAQNVKARINKNDMNYDRQY